MATATNLTDSLRTKTLKYKHTAAVAINDIILLGGRVLIAIAAVLANAEGVYIHAAERVEMPKEAPLVITAGDTVYWDNTNAVITKTATANTKCGIAVEDAASADTVVVIELDNSVNY
ncbi:MAG: DUF2190 family protein [Thermodesulfobacteriota bacterium]